MDLIAFSNCGAPKEMDLITLVVGPHERNKVIPAMCIVLRSHLPRSQNIFPVPECFFLCVLQRKLFNSTSRSHYLGSTQWPGTTLSSHQSLSMKIEYHNLYTHFILVTQNRISSIVPANRERIEKYITGIVNNNRSKLYSIYANPEHVHLLVSRSPRISDELLATIIADSSAKFINENKFSRGKFAWQESAAAFSVSKSDVDRVCKYILNQPEHHRKVTFDEEYDRFIREYQKTIRWDIR